MREPLQDTAWGDNRVAEQCHLYQNKQTRNHKDWSELHFADYLPTELSRNTTQDFIHWPHRFIKDPGSPSLMQAFILMVARTLLPIQPLHLSSREEKIGREKYLCQASVLHDIGFFFFFLLIGFPGRLSQYTSAYNFLPILVHNYAAARGSGKVIIFNWVHCHLQQINK